MASKIIEKANKAGSDELSALMTSLLADYNTANSSSYVLKASHSSELSELQRTQIWNILEANMRNYYEQSSTFSWDPPTKKDEVFHPLSRFILVLSPDDSTVLAYTMFRFECEDGPCVVYCYELQVSEQIKRRGLGKLILSCLYLAGQSYKMSKIVLTVLFANAVAHSFYVSQGFSTDDTSPNYDDDDEQEEEGYIAVSNAIDVESNTVDYDILSKSIAPKPNSRKRKGKGIRS